LVIPATMLIMMAMLNVTERRPINNSFINEIQLQQYRFNICIDTMQAGYSGKLILMEIRTDMNRSKAVIDRIKNRDQ